MSRIRRLIRKSLISLLTEPTNFPWKNIKIQDGVIIEGYITRIMIGEGTTIQLGSVLSNFSGGKITIGKNCFIMRGAMLMTYGGEITIGDHCSINPYSILYGGGPGGYLRIGNYVRMAAQTIIVPMNHLFDSTSIPIYQQGILSRGITIGSDVWIGAGVKILDGVHIGDGVIIGAGAVVHDDMPSYIVCAGVPAKIIRSREQNT